MYTKNITSLLRLLGTSKQSGILLVEAPGQNDSPWQAQFQLDKGIVMSCLLRNKADGRVVLRNDEALRWLANQGSLSWHLQEELQPPDAAPLLLPPGQEPPRGVRSTGKLPPTTSWNNQPSAVPQRTTKGKVVPVNAFASREHRQVFALVDGQRTIDEIVQLLHRSPDSVFRVLQDLQLAGFIA